MTTFVKITNEDIYKEIKDFKKQNIEQHNEIIKHQIETNGKVKLNRWIATTALTLTLFLFGLFMRGI